MRVLLKNETLALRTVAPCSYVAHIPHPAPRGAKCDRYVAKLEGESPLRALVRGTVREGKGVHREVESEESRIQNAGPTNRNRIEAVSLG